jgi:thiol:disulfide interchange protein
MASFQPIATRVAVEAPKGVTVGPIQWPRVEMVEVDFSGNGKPVSYGVFAGKAVAFVPFSVDAGAPAGSEIAIRVTASYQACDDRVCNLPEEESFTITLPVVSLADAAMRDAGAGVDQSLFRSLDLSVFADLTKWREALKFDLFGLSFSLRPDGPAGLTLLLLVAALGGFLLNLTPCVLPVIPLKIMGLSQSAGKPARCLLLGAVMSLGVVAFFLAIGGAIAFVAGFGSINQLFQKPLFSIGVGVFVALMGVGMLGAFNVSLPKFVYFINPGHESVPGSFLFGVMTAVLSTPCTAPFMGTAAAWAATRSAPVTLATFGAIGVGMALPYLILAANPKWVARLPRTGPASSLVKQVMGLLMLAVAAFFVGIGLVAVFSDPGRPASRAYWWVVAGLVVAAGGWLAARTFKITRSPARRAAFAALGFAMSAGVVALAFQLTRRGPIEWVYYTPQLFREAQEKGSVIVVDFTAEWCLNCKAMEEAVLHTPEVVKALESPGVVAMKIDLTGNNTDGHAKLTEVGRVGIPLLAVFGPGLEQPRLADFYTVEWVLQSIDEARR